MDITRYSLKSCVLLLVYRFIRTKGYKENKFYLNKMWSSFMNATFIVVMLCRNTFNEYSWLLLLLFTSSRFIFHYLSTNSSFAFSTFSLLFPSQLSIRHQKCVYSKIRSLCETSFYCFETSIHLAPDVMQSNSIMRVHSGPHSTLRPLSKPSQL